MNNFGKLLRGFRSRSVDPVDLDRRLSQERLGELLGLELGSGFSGAAVSDWERGKSKVHADQRPVLVSLVKVLHRQGGIKTVSEANELLEAGNYRALDPLEKQQVFPDEQVDLTLQARSFVPKNPHWIFSFILEKVLFPSSNEELKELIAEAEEGPSPSWPRVVVALLQKGGAGWTAFRALGVLLWIWTLFLTWELMAPSFRLPFDNREHAISAIVLYASGTLIIPLLVGIQTTTKDKEFWRHHNLATATLTRLYTYQGASIGFHLGYFAVFFVCLLAFYIHLTFAVWVGVPAMALLLLSSYLGARLIPYNLWLAYGRLNLADGGIFFFFILLGPIWGLFYFELYTVLLTPIVGFLTLFLAITICAALIAGRHDRTGTTLHREKP